MLNITNHQVSAHQNHNLTSVRMAITQRQQQKLATMWRKGIPHALFMERMVVISSGLGLQCLEVGLVFPTRNWAGLRQ